MRKGRYSCGSGSHRLAVTDTLSHAMSRPGRDDRAGMLPASDLNVNALSLTVRRTIMSSIPFSPHSEHPACNGPTRPCRLTVRVRAANLDSLRFCSLTLTNPMLARRTQGFKRGPLVLQRRLCKTAVFSGKSRPMSRLCWPSAPVIAAIRVSRSSTKAALRSYWKNPSL